MRILWVEDQYADNREYAHIHAEHGSDVTHVSTVAEALRRISDETFDCIVLDLKVPLGEGMGTEAMTDLDYNAVHIITFLEQRRILGALKVVCLTNFANAARQLFEGKPIVVSRKTGFLREFEEIIYGED